MGGGGGGGGGAHGLCAPSLDPPISTLNLTKLVRCNNVNSFTQNALCVVVEFISISRLSRCLTIFMMAIANHTNNTYEIFEFTIGVTGLLLFPVMLVILLLMIFVYKTYKTTFQRLILYYVILGLWSEFSSAILIVEVFGHTEWFCIIKDCLYVSSAIAWYTYIMVISNFSLLLVPCLIKGTPVSKLSIKCVECICVLSTAIIALVVTSSELVEYLDAVCINLKPVDFKSTIVYVTLHEKTKHIALKMIFELRRPLPTAAFELVFQQI